MLRLRPARSVAPITRASPGAEAFAAAALLAFYLAVMSGHLFSMDGLYMARQAHTLVFDHTIRFQTPVWTWKPKPGWNSMYGIGLSLLYVPGMLAAATLRSEVPISLERPPDLWAFYLRELYQDPLYTVGASWVHAVIGAVTAYLVARLIVALGCSRRASLWGMAFYGLGSSALVYARGDFAQPLEGLCWTAALLAALAFRRRGTWTALLGCAAAVGYAILTRPVEGMLLVPAAAMVLLPARPLGEWRPSTLRPVLVMGLGALAAGVATLLINRARFGEALQSGYPDDVAWIVPDVVRWAAVLISPGRGILWEFPAVVLVPFGAVALARLGRRREAITLLALCGALLVNVAAWFMWWGGWCWGLRLFTPATPLLAVLAGAGVDRLRGRKRGWLPALLLLAGFLWAMPGVVTDIHGGYGGLADGTQNAWQLAAYPPYGAWQFLVRLRAEMPADAGAADILWLRLARETGNGSLLVPILLVALAAILAMRSRALVRAGEKSP